jgi:hypothetical protein
VQLGDGEQEDNGICGVREDQLLRAAQLLCAFLPTVNLGQRHDSMDRAAYRR